MKIYNIYKVGQSGYRVNNVVDEFTYERRYKPQGWLIEGEEEPKVLEPIDEMKIVEERATEKRKSRKKQFDDKIIKDE